MRRNLFKFSVNKYFRSLFPFLILIPSFLLFSKEFSFFIYNGCVIYLITGYWLQSDISVKRLLVRGAINILILILFICAVVFFKFHHKLELNFIYVVLPFFAICFLSFNLSLNIGHLLKHKVVQSDRGKFIFIVLLLNLILINSGAFGWPTQFCVGGISLFIGGFILASDKLKRNMNVISFLSGPIVIIMSVFMFKDRLFHLLPILLIIPFATIIGIYMRILHIRRVKVIQSYIILALYVMMLIIGYLATLNWIEFVFSKDNNPKINNLSIKFLTLDGNEVNEGQFLNKITVLYLWTTSCHVCFDKMPELEKLTKSFINIEHIRIYAVVIPTGILDSTNNRILDKLNIKYKINFAISIENCSVVTKNFNFNTFPRVLIIDDGGELIYNGRFNNNPLIKVNNITSILNHENIKFKESLKTNSISTSNLSSQTVPF